MIYPSPFEPQFVVLVVWGLVMLAGSVGGIVAILVAWLGRPGGMLIGGVVLGVGAAVMVAMIFQIPRFWFIAVPPMALGIQTLRMYRNTPTEPKSRWSIQLSTIALLLVAISACLAGITAVQRQRKQDEIAGQQIEAAGGFVVWSFDGTIGSVYVRNQSAEALAEATPAILKLQSVTDLGLEGTPVTSELLLQFASQLPGLKALSLQNAKLTGDIGNALAEFRGLRRLDLIRANLGDDDLPPLARLTDLERLYLDQTQATPAAIRRLRAQLPDTEVSGD